MSFFVNALRIKRYAYIQYKCTSVSNSVFVCFSNIAILLPIYLFSKSSLNKKLLTIYLIEVHERDTYAILKRKFTYLVIDLF